MSYYEQEVSPIMVGECYAAFSPWGSLDVGRVIQVMLEADLWWDGRGFEMVDSWQEAIGGEITDIVATLFAVIKYEVEKEIEILYGDNEKLSKAMEYIEVHENCLGTYYKHTDQAKKDLAKVLRKIFKKNKITQPEHGGETKYEEVPRFVWWFLEQVEIEL